VERFQTLLVPPHRQKKTFCDRQVRRRTGGQVWFLAHNKQLAASSVTKLREISSEQRRRIIHLLHDYYSRGPYVPVSDNYIAKTLDQQGFDMLRHFGHRSCSSGGRDCVASISCIYGLGIPRTYLKAAVKFSGGREPRSARLLRSCE